MHFVFVFCFFQEMRRPKFPAAFVFWLGLWMPGTKRMLLKHSAFVNLTLLFMWLHQFLASITEDEVAAVIEPTETVQLCNCGPCQILSTED